MISSSRLLQICLGATATALIAALLYTYLTIDRRQGTLADFSRHNVAFSAIQAVIEFQRLEKALLVYSRTGAPADREEIALRYEILYNRTEVLGQGEFAKLTATDPKLRLLALEFDKTVEALDPLIASGGDLDADAILASLAPLEPAMVSLVGEANRHNAEKLTEDGQTVMRLQRWFSGLVFALAVCGLILVGALVVHNRLLTRTQSDLRETQRAVQTANTALRRQNRELSEKEAALQTQNLLVGAALNNMSQGLCVFDRSLRIAVCNAQFDRLFSATKGGAASGTLHDLAPDIAARIAENVSADRSAPFEVARVDGTVIAVVQGCMSDDRWVATFEDVSEQRRAQARIAHLARHDGLTNLPNRYAFRERTQEALAASAEAGGMLAVMCLDLDNFKAVNDSLGHPTGDALLCAAAERLARSVRDTDMVARFGGDEFAILQSGIARRSEAEQLAGRILEELRKPFLINGEMVYATGSIGIAVSPLHGNDPDVLQKNADLALYAAKADGKRTCRFFESAMDEHFASRHSIERDLRQAIAAEDLYLHYQPIVDLRTRRMTGLEALLRWTHPVHGSVPPSVFIPIAEDAGLINQIGRFVLARACADAVRWPAHLRVAVNLSVAQFTRGDVVEDIRTALSRAGLRPERLAVEITESLLLTESISTFDTLRRLKAMQVEIAMDDFGTGYSSLNYLRKYDFDRIKIDREFISTARQAPANVAIIQAIVRLGESLGMRTVAEGIETEGDLDMLIALGCAEGQGYLFSRPLPHDKALEMIVNEANAGLAAHRMAAA